jgi:hypothetical protein
MMSVVSGYEFLAIESDGPYPSELRGRVVGPQSWLLKAAVHLDLAHGLETSGLASLSELIGVVRNP